MELIQFNLNDASSSSPSFVGSAFLVERTGSPVSNTTGPLETVEPPDSSSSSPASAPAAVQQSVGGSAADSIGVARDIYCFQNSPYDCEAYFGGGADGDADTADVQLEGAFRCNACKGAAFTGMGSAEGAPVPAPVDVDDDDGLSQMGQERAQGGTPSPVGPGGPDTGENTETGDVLGEESEPELLGATGGMRWVVVGLIVGIGGALLVCMCLLTVCRTNGKKKTARTLEALDGAGEEEGRLRGAAAMVGPRSGSASSVVAGDTQEKGLGSGGIIATENPFFATSPRTSAAADVNAETSRTFAATAATTSRRAPGGSGGGDLSRSSSSRRPSGADLSRSNSSSRRPSGADMSRSNSSSRRPSGADMSRSNSSSRRPSGADMSRSNSRRPSGAEVSRSNSRRPSATESSRASSRRPSGRVAAAGGGGRDRDPRRDTGDSAVAVVNELTPHASEMRDRELARQRSIEMTSEDCWGSPPPPLVSAWGESVPVGGAGHVAVSTKSTPTKQGFTALEDEHYQETKKKRDKRSRSREKRGAGGEAQPPPYGELVDSAEAAAEAASRVAAMPRGRQQERGRGRGSGSTARRSSARELGSPDPVVVVVQRRPTRSAETSRSAERKPPPPPPQQQQQQFRSSPHSRARIKPLSGATHGSPSTERTTTDRALARAVKTPAGGARLSISTASTPAREGASKGRGRGRVNASGKAVTAATAAAVAGAATELEASGEPSQWQADATMVSSEENPVYSHDRSDAGGTKRSNSRSRFRITSQSPVRRSNSSRRRGDSGERGASAARGGGGWASELYRISPGPKKERSAKIYSGKFDASRSDWSADGEVEWNRHS